MPHLHVTLFTVIFLQVIVAAEEPIQMKEALALGATSKQSGRTIFHSDPVELAIVSGEWKPPREGDVVTRLDGKEVKWQAVTSDEKGHLGNPSSPDGYVYWEVESLVARVAILAASGHSLVYTGIDPESEGLVSVEMRTGNPYRKGYVQVPVALRAGKNGFLFRHRRGPVKAELLPADGAMLLSKQDSTLPDLIREEAGPFWGALRLTNATLETQTELEMAVTLDGGETLVTVLPDMPPLSVRKVPVLIPQSKDQAAEKAQGRAVLLQRQEELGTEMEVSLRQRDVGDKHNRTFTSEIDGSVQYYALRPAVPVGKVEDRPALVLSLHGAGVEGSGMAASYSPKAWAHIVSPTNRRPFGFDWEDWGRLDAIEVLELAAERYETDPLRSYLTGHSMGGHGTWHIGVTFPDRFAVVAPSAGWVSFRSYASAPSFDGESSVGQVYNRATAPSDTLGLADNLGAIGVYVLHGDADDNVPVTEARKMKDRLSGTHEDFHYHEQPGAKHWWGSSDEPGSECCDWGPMFDIFARRALPTLPLQVDFRTASPGVSADCHWLRVEAQQKDLVISHASVRLDPGLRRFVGTTDNISRLSLSVAGLVPADTVRVELDISAPEGEEPASAGLDVPWPTEGDRITLRLGDSGWVASAPASSDEKGPHRYGLFRDAFRNRAALVYGTAGTPEENAWAYARARYDSETFWVRGNGAFDLVTDKQFLAGAVSVDRNVVLYGNADSNAAWDALLKDSPVQVRRDAVTVGEQKLEGDDLLALFIRPRPDSSVASVGVVAGTGVSGMRLSDRLPYFVSGVGMPDLTVLGVDMLAGKGMDAVRVAGFFGPDWSLETGDMAWK